MTLVEFLERRLSDTIAEARYAQAEAITAGQSQRSFAYLSLDVLIKTCQAQRAILGDYAKALHIESQGHVTAYSEGERGAYETAVLALAAVYSNHADFDSSWAAGETTP